MIEKSLINNINFADLYRKQQERSGFRHKRPAEWNKRADKMAERQSAGMYTDEFISRLDLDGAETMLDIGCGTGEIPLALAGRLKKITALDFSDKMLEILRRKAEEKGISNIETMLHSWYDDWQSVPSADIVTASRSTELEDIQAGLAKLHEKARKRVYLTYRAGPAFIEKEILRELDSKIIPRPDYIYVLNVLYNMGIEAKLDFIYSDNRYKHVNDFSEFLEIVSWHAGEIDSDDTARLREFYRSGRAEEVLQRPVKWAFISWEK